MEGASESEPLAGVTVRPESALAVQDTVWTPAVTFAASSVAVDELPGDNTT
jgi:hypothetical protein